MYYYNFSNKVTIVVLTSLSLLLFYIYSSQITFGAFIQCPPGTRCYGTPDNDIIISNNIPGVIIHGGAGNDYITSSRDDIASTEDKVNEVLIYGDDGDDTLIGGTNNDYLNGGKGNDKYYGGFGDDTLIETSSIRSGGGDSYVFSGNDYMFGSIGDDYIDGGLGADKIFGGNDNDYIIPGPLLHPDFSIDIIDCGPGRDSARQVFRTDGDIDSNCEIVTGLVGD